MSCVMEGRSMEDVKYLSVKSLGGIDEPGRTHACDRWAWDRQMHSEGDGEVVGQT